MQGFNMGRYHPPASLDGSLSSTGTKEGGFNSQGHPLGKRANKISSGILVVRFEMPFATWCTTCKPEALIAQGIRFNAEKKKVGNYYSTPIWSFKMKHSACGGVIEIRTDPKNSEYVVHEGGRRKDPVPSRIEEGVFGEILTEEERERRRQDAFAELEGKNKDKETAKNETKRLEELMKLTERDWKDPAERNAKLRRTFRVERKIRETNEKNKQELTERLGLDIEVLDEIAADRQRAQLVDFGSGASLDTDVAKQTSKRPLFEDRIKSERQKLSDHTVNAKKTKAQLQSEKTKAILQKELRDNTRAAIDPFNWKNDKSHESAGSIPLMVGVKRKRVTHEKSEHKDMNENETKDTTSITQTTESGSGLLVEYESDD
jgi:coiled-coil domain-containing protein 130